MSHVAISSMAIVVINRGALECEHARFLKTVPPPGGFLFAMAHQRASGAAASVRGRIVDVRKTNRIAKATIKGNSGLFDESIRVHRCGAAGAFALNRICWLYAGTGALRNTMLGLPIGSGGQRDDGALAVRLQTSRLQTCSGSST